MKKFFDKLKAFIDVWKIWIFVAALFGTNGAQMYVNSEPTSEKPAKTVSTPMKLQKTTIIHKIDNQFCIDLIEKHKTGVLH